MALELRRGLAEARMLAVEHRGVLAVYAAIGVVLPFLLLSSEPIFNLRNLMAIFADPWTYRVSGSITGPLYLIGIVSVLVAGALLAAWNAILTEMREGYISEIMSGMVAGVGFLLVNVIASLVIGFGLATIIALTIGIREWSAMTGAIVLIPRVASWLLSSWLSSRFCLAGPVMGAEGKLEPVSAFIESWRLTATARLPLFGLYVGVNLVAGVVIGVLMAAHIAFIMNSDPGSFAELAMSAIWMLFWAAYFLAMVLIPAGLYRASEPVGSAEVFA